MLENNRSENIEYKTPQLAQYYQVNRRRWNEFYPSEQYIFGKVAGEEKQLGRVLDVGCAAGGLMEALNEKFTVDHYTGVDINRQCIDIAKQYQCINDAFHNSTFIHGDILNRDMIRDNYFDNVISLSCADWNIRVNEVINRCWMHVRPRGHFILTLRLTDKESILDFKKSYQYINFKNNPPEEATHETAPYIVLNIIDALSICKHLNPKPRRITAYGYWGNPSPTAVTPYNRLVFTAISIEKGASVRYETELDAVLPLDILV
ncbi:class I SAM-dependent methyltransferase [Patescibacteria group bacterium]|nr:class I SAM-dependent methyltransferase [Patescibacteria group bacterium]